MALFAAYANIQGDKSPANTNNASTSETAWLANSSFKIDVTPFQASELQLLHRKHYDSISDVDNDDDDTIEPRGRAKKRKKSKKKSRKSHKRGKHNQSGSESEGTQEYTIDKARVTEYKYANTIVRPNAPRYKIYKYIALPRGQKVKKFKRYYQVILDKHVNESASEDEKLTVRELDSTQSRQSKDSKNVMLEEQEMTSQTATYNRELQADPSNIDMWMEYVHFQDAIFNFEKSFRKGSIAKGQRVTAERKLAILDRALQHNPDCEILLRTQLQIAVSVFPADELQVQLAKLVDRDSGNIILWQGYIEASQCSMSHCTSPAVINLYIKCLHTLHTLRRTAKLNRALLEESILRMLYQCGLFLRQAGLFEQLWTLLRMYLELNLADEAGGASVFGAAAAAGADEKQLVDLEDTVLKSQLPIHELWLRVEKLREASHWLPVRDAQCEDPQRVVFAEDVSELIHPITMPGNTLRLTVTILTLLKVPLLPCRHATMKEFGTDHVPWALDSVETLLPTFYSLYPLGSNDHLLHFAQKLAVGPQYLKCLPGQEEYLQFVLAVMQSCINCLTGRDRMAVTIWYFRFLRLLSILEKNALFKVPSTCRKRLKSNMKALLKDNAANVVLFKEYALVEQETAFDAGVGILKTALGTSTSGSVIAQEAEGKTARVSALRSLLELLIFRDEKLENDTRHTCLKHIAAAILGEFTAETAPRFITQALIARTKEKFVDASEDVLKAGATDALLGVDHFLPDFTTDWLILNALFLHLSDGVGAARVFVANAISQWQQVADRPADGDGPSANQRATLSLRIEVLREFAVAMLFKACVDHPGSGMYPTLDAYLHEGVRSHPNNLFLLSTLAKLQSLHPNHGQPWWRTQQLLLGTGHALSALFAVLIADQRISDVEANWTDTVTGAAITADSTFRNRLHNLFRRLTRGDICTRRCGLVWRLYLQFLHAHFEPKVCRDAYYLAVEECPWLKSLYIDAAIYIPEDLAQIQDLIIEKQLRIHVTPDELDVLRG